MEKKISIDQFYYLQGYHFYSANNYQLAILWFDKAIELNPENKEALIYRSLAKFTLGDFSGSMADFSKCMFSDLSGQDTEMQQVVFEKDDIESLLSEYKDIADNFRTNYCTGSNTTLLIESIIHGESDLASYLILKGADVNEQDPSGRTALMAACANGAVDTAKQLVFSGAKINLLNVNGESAFSLACKNGHWKIAEWLTEIDPENKCKLITNGLYEVMKRNQFSASYYKDTFFLLKKLDSIEIDKWKN